MRVDCQVLEQHSNDLVMEIWGEIMTFRRSVADLHRLSVAALRRESQMKQKADLQKHLTRLGKINGHRERV